MRLRGMLSRLQQHRAGLWSSHSSVSRPAAAVVVAAATAATPAAAVGTDHCRCCCRRRRVGVAAATAPLLPPLLLQQWPSSPWPAQLLRGAATRAAARRDKAAAAPTAEAAAAAAAPPAAAYDDGSEGAPHAPVLLREVLAAFDGRRVAVYVDGTLGAGGHAAHVARRHPELRTLVGVDLDPTAHRIAGERLAREQERRKLERARAAAAAAGGGEAGDGSTSSNGAAAAAAAAPTGAVPEPLDVHVVRGNYSRLPDLLAALPGGSLVGAVDALVLDLGVSSMQLDTAARGFSFAADGPLDMRLDPDAPLTAADIVNGWSEAAIGRALLEYGEEKMWRVVARR